MQAYQDELEPPTVTRPHPNVRVQFTTITQNQGRPIRLGGDIEANTTLRQLREWARIAPGQPTVDVLVSAIGADELGPLMPAIVESMGYDTKLNLLIEVLTAMPKQHATTLVAGLLCKLDELSESEWLEDMEKTLFAKFADIDGDSAGDKGEKKQVDVTVCNGM